MQVKTFALRGKVAEIHSWCSTVCNVNIQHGSTGEGRRPVYFCPAIAREYYVRRGIVFCVYWLQCGTEWQERCANLEKREVAVYSLYGDSVFVVQRTR